MAKSKNNWKIVLCFINGEPYLYNKKTKTYVILHITPETALELVKQSFNIISKRPKMQEIWQLLAKNINCCDGYSSYFRKCSVPNRNSFENIFTNKITEFLNEFYPPELVIEFAKKRREFEKIQRAKRITFEQAKKASNVNQNTIKRGRKLY